MSLEIPEFRNHADFCAYLQRSLKAELEEMAIELRTPQRELKLIQRRIAELDKSIAANEREAGQAGAKA